MTSHFVRCIRIWSEALGILATLSLSAIAQVPNAYDNLTCVGGDSHRHVASAKYYQSFVSSPAGGTGLHQFGDPYLVYWDAHKNGFDWFSISHHENELVTQTTETRHIRSTRRPQVANGSG